MKISSTCSRLEMLRVLRFVSMCLMVIVILLVSVHPILAEEVSDPEETVIDTEEVPDSEEPVTDPEEVPDSEEPVTDPEEVADSEEPVTDPEEVSDSEEPVTDPGQGSNLDGLQTDVYNTWSQAVEANKGIQELKDSLEDQKGLITDYQKEQKKDGEEISNGLSEVKKDTDNILSVLNSSLNSEVDPDNPPKTLDDVYNLLYVLINTVWMGLGLKTGLYIMRCAFV